MKHLFSTKIIPSAWRAALLLSLFLFGLAPAVQAQVEIFNEDGGGPPPAGWSLNDDPSGDEPVDQSSYWLVESGLAPVQENVLTSTYDLDGYNTMIFTVRVRGFGSGVAGPLTVQVSTDGGFTFPQSYVTGNVTNSYRRDSIFITSVSATTVIRLVNLGPSNGRGIRMQNIKLEGNPPAVSTISTGAIAGSPFCLAGSGVAVSVPYVISGTYTPGNVFSAELSNATGSFLSGTTIIGTVVSTSSGTIPATIPAFTPSGSDYRIRVISTTPSIAGTDNATNLTIVNASTQTVVGAASSPANTQITLQWTNPLTCFDDVLVVARAGAPVGFVPVATSYPANAAFGTPGTDVGGGQFAVYQGPGTGVVVTGLTNGLPYHFAIYTRRGTVYGPAVNLTNIPTSGPALTEVLVPRYMAGRSPLSALHQNRLPYAFRVTINGLTPSATYRYTTRGVATGAGPADNGAGQPIYALAGGFTRPASFNLLISGFSTLTADAGGSYSGWFVLEPNDDARFIAGQQVQLRILLNDGTASSAIATRLTTASSASMLLLGNGPADGTGIMDSSLATPRNFVMLWDNEAGSGRPLSGSFVESDGTANTTANRYTGFYASRVHTINNKWGTLIPNNNPNGVRRIEQRAFSNGALVGCAATDADGVWSSLASTVNPTSGSTPVVLSAIDAPLVCGVYVGINPRNQAQPEGSGASSNVPIRVTVNQQPATALTVQVTNAGGGTAVVGSDYLFNGQTLTFPASGTYPMTKTVVANFIGDVVVEANETFNLSVSILSGGPATVLQSPATIIIADDDFQPTGLVLNEVSNGPSSDEYIELLVTGTPGGTVDLRGWIVDDNNGSFSGTTTTGVGISAGHFRFDNSCTWEKVRVGSLIVLYNEANRNALLPPSDDPTDGDLDFLYVVPVRNAGGCGTIVGNSGDYLDGNCTSPSTSDSTYAAATVGPRWSTVSFGNNDAVQVRAPSVLQPTVNNGLSFATSGSSAINAANHPDFPIYGANALFFLGSFQTYFVSNGTGTDFRSKSNWTAHAGAGQETPGTPNNVRNGQFIESLRQPLVPTSVTSTYVCEVRPQETRVFLDGSNRLMLRLVNQSATDHGSVNSQTVVSGGPSQNTNLEGDPFFLAKQYRVTPTDAAPANYNITFYVTDAELDAFASYVSSVTGEPRTAAALRPRLQIYKNDGTVLPSAETDDSGLLIATPTIGSYSSGVTTYSATFTSFSTFALGATVEEVLPVELTRLTAVAAPNRSVRVEWATASEKNADYFEVQRSADGREFVSLGRVQAHGTTSVANRYSFVDGKPVAGLGYYRLRQVDLDGAARLSDIVTVRTGAPLAGALEAWPVPVENTLNLRLTAPVSGMATVRVLELQGRTVLVQPATLSVGQTEIVVPTANLASGTYMIEVQLPGGEVLRRKVTK